MILRKIYSYYKDLDWLMLGVIFILVCFGIVTIYGVALAADIPDYSNFKKQIIFAIIGFAGFFFASSINYKSLNSYSVHIYIICLILLVTVLFFGNVVRGTKGWITFFGYNLQPVELAKIGLIIFLAKFFSKTARHIDLLKNLILSGLLVFIPVFLVLMQPDFGSALVLLGIWLLLLIIIGIKRLHLLSLIFIMILLVVGAWFFFLQDYQKNRIMTFIDPSQDPLGQGYNITQATIAVGSGQLYGRGLGYGSQSQLKFLPESQTDFIFAVIAEELGFIGVFIVLFLWFIFFWRMLRGIKLCSNDFGIFMGLGICILFLIHIVVNIGMNIGIAPVTGISLPFLSYGGSFLISALFMSGLVQSIIIRK